MSFAAFLLATASALQPGHPGTVPDAELALRGVAISASKPEVRRLLGAPNHTHSDGERSAWEYPGLTVFVDIDGVSELLATGRNACTPAGACPGMRFAEVERLYGPAGEAKRETGVFMEYSAATTPCWLQLSVAKGVVRSIAIKCQP